ncbi:hypothetical protein [Bradyrhizobium sp. NAS96.2]|uniref:hypothetical protein n=1 Tax=Bradyrhizobium sp. NAS96.2 TaxID=1680160 RepID=UPI00093B2F50|nr:hypothetical protein [Bradyrhizobium sp. NAS96.2]OKO79971.1 hypothetical protein AC628_10235 [Bradyrhizobium sp. NAS96.2]
MQKRRRFEQTQTLRDRLASYAQQARELAAALPPCPKKEDLLCKARQADTASHLNEWVSSPGLQPPR